MATAVADDPMIWPKKRAGFGHASSRALLSISGSQIKRRRLHPFGTLEARSPRSGIPLGAIEIGTAGLGPSTSPNLATSSPSLSVATPGLAGSPASGIGIAPAGVMWAGFNEFMNRSLSQRGKIVHNRDWNRNPIGSEGHR